MRGEVRGERGVGGEGAGTWRLPVLHTCHTVYMYLWSAVVVPDACCHASAHQQRRVLLAVLGQDELSVTRTHILRSPHEEHLTPSTALTLLLTLLIQTHTQNNISSHNKTNMSVINV